MKRKTNTLCTTRELKINLKKIHYTDGIDEDPNKNGEVIQRLEQPLSSLKTVESPQEIVSQGVCGTVYFSYMMCFRHLGPCHHNFWYQKTFVLLVHLFSKTYWISNVFPHFNPCSPRDSQLNPFINLGLTIDGTSPVLAFSTSQTLEKKRSLGYWHVMRPRAIWEDKLLNSIMHYFPTCSSQKKWHRQRENLFPSPGRTASLSHRAG